MVDLKDEDGKKFDSQQASSMLDLAVRPDKGGKAGRDIKIVSNLFPVKIQLPRNEDGDTVLMAYHYDVDIKPLVDPDAPPPREREDRRRSSKPDNEKLLPVPLCQRVFEQAVTKAGAREEYGLTPELASSFAFDGRRNAYTPKTLSIASFELEVELANAPGRKRKSANKFTVLMRKVQEVDLSILENYCSGDLDKSVKSSGKDSVLNKVITAMQALDILFRHDPSKTYKVHGAGGRKFFDGNNARHVHVAAQGAEIWQGFFQSVRPCSAGIVINLDVAFSAFLTSGDLRVVAAKILGKGGAFGGGGRGGRGGGRGGYGGDRGGYGGGNNNARVEPVHDLDQRELVELRKRLRNAKIITTHRTEKSRPAPFKGFSDRAAGQMKFQKDGREISIADYYHEQYNITLRSPNLPCVDVGGGKKWVPMELCEVEAGTPLQPFSLTPQQTQDMIKLSASKPLDRRDRTTNVRGDLAYEKSTVVKSWGVEVDQRMQGTAARVLPPPMISYSGRTMNIRDGAWNLGGARFSKAGAPLRCWAVINYTRRHSDELMHFVNRSLCEAMYQLGVKIEKEPVIHTVDMRTVPFGGSIAAACLPRVSQELKAAGKKAWEGSGRSMDPQLFVVFLDGQEVPLYEAIKRECAMRLKIPVPSQVLQVKKALNDRGQQQYCANVAMKINVKLGGINQVVSPESLPRIDSSVMVVGMDVTHPGPNTGLPSIAASVAIIDNVNGKFSSQIRTQYNPDQRGRQSQELFLDTRVIFEEHLRVWKKTHGQLPSRIITFRDGISEGQHARAKDMEVEEIRAAARSLAKEDNLRYEPTVSYIICTTHHNLRFFAASERDTDRTGNLPAGTVIDTDVTHPYAYDFYLQSHSGLVGTARPCRYTVLHDENKLGSDDLQKMVNSMCYEYQRATRAVSTVTVCYYSSILTEKARALIYEDGFSSGASTISSGSGERPKRDIPDVMPLLNRTAAFANSLWYM